jgi:hypothetical protein
MKMKLCGKPQISSSKREKVFQELILETLLNGNILSALLAWSVPTLPHRVISLTINLPLYSVKKTELNQMSLHGCVALQFKKRYMYL